MGTGTDLSPPAVPGDKNAGLGHRAGPALAGTCMSSACGAAGACWPSTATAATPLSAGMCPSPAGGHPRPLPRRPDRQPHRRRPLRPGWRAIWKRPGPPASPALMAAGRWPSSTGRGRTCWRWTCAWTRNARPSPCWTAPSTPAPAGAQALRDWGQGWSGYPHRCYERDAGHPPLVFSSASRALQRLL